MFDYSIYQDKVILIGISGGINSMAVMCHLIESSVQPKEVHLFYAHFKEHSPDTMRFVMDGFDYAKKHFQNVITKITYNSIIEYFEKENIIPHPMNSPCSKNLKIIPMAVYAFENRITNDLVGYVKHEIKKRGERQQAVLQVDLFSPSKDYTIASFSDEWCFEIVDRHIGWYPAIYDIKDEKGERVFLHNNCLPCKNGNPNYFANVGHYFPEYYDEAQKLSERLNKFWGRQVDDFYKSFDGRELGQDVTCETCKW